MLLKLTPLLPLSSFVSVFSVRLYATLCHPAPVPAFFCLPSLVKRSVLPDLYQQCRLKVDHYGFRPVCSHLLVLPRRGRKEALPPALKKTCDEEVSLSLFCLTLSYVQKGFENLPKGFLEAFMQVHTNKSTIQ